jgi:hypothetical protein
MLKGNEYIKRCHTENIFVNPKNNITVTGVNSIAHKYVFFEGTRKYPPTAIAVKIKLNPNKDNADSGMLTLIKLKKK